MKPMRFFLSLVAALAFMLSLAVRPQAQTFTTLASFSGGNGEYPLYGPLIQATNGNYYGTTNAGGKHGGGTIFEVTPAGKLTDIYNFCSQAGCTDGEFPWSSLVLGSDGNFYGTTYLGGSYGVGTVFKMTVGGKLSTLYSFCVGCADGYFPVGLVQASNGNFYGAASSGGANSGGDIFEISSTGKFRVLYSFCSLYNCTDGHNLYSGPMQASNGNLYGTTFNGGAYNAGTVYEITLAGLLETLYSFCSPCADGQQPVGGLTQDSNGNLYGTTWQGGAYNLGTVFRITATGQLTTLHTFDDADGANPNSAPIQASDGNFYGVATGGGPSSGGTIYEITSAGVFSALYSFCIFSGCTGENPVTLWQATDGAFIGTTQTGGADGFGSVFSFSIGLGALAETVPVAAKAGASVIILGNNLTGSSSVTFNGTPAAFDVVSDTYITATVPTGASTGTVSVTTPSGVLKSNPTFQVLP